MVRRGRKTPARCVAALVGYVVGIYNLYWNLFSTAAYCLAVFPCPERTEVSVTFKTARGGQREKDGGYKSKFLYPYIPRIADAFNIDSRTGASNAFRNGGK